MRFRKAYPPVPPKQDYSPTRSTQKPPGYSEIEATAQWTLEDTASWVNFVTGTMKMPEAFTPAVQEAIRQQRWKIAPNPLASVRMTAYQEAKKMGLG